MRPRRRPRERSGNYVEMCCLWLLGRNIDTAFMLSLFERLLTCDLPDDAAPHVAAVRHAAALLGHEVRRPATDTRQLSLFGEVAAIAAQTLRKEADCPYCGKAEGDACPSCGGVNAAAWADKATRPDASPSAWRTGVTPRLRCDQTTATGKPCAASVTVSGRGVQDHEQVQEEHQNRPRRRHDPRVPDASHGKKTGPAKLLQVDRGGRRHRVPPGGRILAPSSTR